MRKFRERLEHVMHGRSDLITKRKDTKIMAKINGVPPFVGTLGDLQIYKRGDKYYARRNTNNTESSLKKSPNRKRHRRHISEFGTSSSFAKVLRMSTGHMEPKPFYSDTSADLTAKILEITRKGEGEYGKRSIELSRNGHLLHGFLFDPKRNPQHHFNAEPQFQLETTPDGYSLKMSFPAKTKLLPGLSNPQANHYHLILQATIISDYHYSADEEILVAEHGFDSHSHTYATTSAIPLDQHPSSNNHITLELPAKAQPGQNLIISWGIEYLDIHQPHTNHIHIHQDRQKPKTDASLAIATVMALPERNATGKTHPTQRETPIPTPKQWKS